MEQPKKRPTPLTLTIDTDQDPIDPCEDDGWKTYSFSRRVGRFVDPYKYLKPLAKGQSTPEGVNIGFRRKLAAGTAFILSCYQHGGIAWSLMGEGMQDRWDTARIAGLLIWEQPTRNLGPKTYEKRQEDARRFLETYNQYSNGECYYFTLEDANGNEIDRGDSYGSDCLFEAIREATTDYKEDEIVVKGDAKWLADHDNIVGPVKKGGEVNAEAEGGR